MKRAPKLRSALPPAVFIELMYTMQTQMGEGVRRQDVHAQEIPVMPGIAIPGVSKMVEEGIKECRWAGVNGVAGWTDSGRVAEEILEGGVQVL